MNPYLLLAASIAYIAVAVGAFYEGSHIKGLADDKAIAAQKITAANELLAANQATAAKELERAQLATQLEAANAKADSDISAAYAAYSATVAASGGLRDKAGRCGPDGGSKLPSPSAGAPSSAPATTGCQLSGSVSDALFSLAADADRILEQARTCQSWAVSISK